MATPAKMRSDGRKHVDQLYSIMQSVENKLGGGEGVEGCYGSLTQASMQKVYDSLSHNTGFDQNSVVVDVGAGLGRPLLHAIVDRGVAGALGIELDAVKVHKAKAFMQQARTELERRGVQLSSVLPEIRCCSIEEVSSLDEATHAYSFWEGVPHSGKQAFGALFHKSKRLRAVAVVQRAIRGVDPAVAMREMGFGHLILVSQFAVKMSGSGRSFQAYIFSKTTAATEKLLNSLSSPAAAAQRPQAQGAEVAQANLVGTHAAAGTEKGEALAANGEMASAAAAAAAAAQGEHPAAPEAVQLPSTSEDVVIVEASDLPREAQENSGGKRKTPKLQQATLPSLPLFARRRKTTAGVGAKTDGAAGKGEQLPAAPAVAMRSSSRIAARAAQVS